MNQEQIEAALEPFAKEADKYAVDWRDTDTLALDDTGRFHDISIGDLRRARAALSSLREAKGDESEAEPTPVAKAKRAFEDIFVLCKRWPEDDLHLGFILPRDPNEQPRVGDLRTILRAIDDAISEISRLRVLVPIAQEAREALLQFACSCTLNCAQGHDENDGCDAFGAQLALARLEAALIADPQGEGKEKP